MVNMYLRHVRRTLIVSAQNVMLVNLSILRCLRVLQVAIVFVISVARYACLDTIRVVLVHHRRTGNVLNAGVNVKLGHLKALRARQMPTGNVLSVHLDASMVPSSRQLVLHRLIVNARIVSRVRPKHSRHQHALLLLIGYAGGVESDVSEDHMRRWRVPS